MSTELAVDVSCVVSVGSGLQGLLFSGCTRKQPKGKDKGTCT